MAISKVGIGNLALSLIGTRSTISSFDQDSTEAKEIKRWYDQAREETLAGFDWSFARRRQALALHSEAPPEQWEFRYQVPSGMLVARRIWNPLGDLKPPINFELETQEDGAAGSILTNMEKAELIFTFDQTNVAMFSPHFRMTLAHALAAKIAYNLTGKAEIAKTHFQLFQGYLGVASMHDANQGIPAGPKEASWIAGRV